MLPPLESLLSRLAAPVVRHVPQVAAVSHVGLTLVLVFRLIVAVLFFSMVAFATLSESTAIPRLSSWVVVGYCLYVVLLAWLWLFRRRAFASATSIQLQFAFDVAFGLLLMATSGRPGASWYYFVFTIPIALSTWYSSAHSGISVLLVLFAWVLAEHLRYGGQVLRSDYPFLLLLRISVLGGAWVSVRIARQHLREQALTEARQLVLRDDHPAYLIRPDYSLVEVNTGTAGGTAATRPRIGQSCYSVIAGRAMPCDGCPVPVVLTGEDVQGNGTVALGGLSAIRGNAEVTAYRVLGHEASGAPQAVRLTLEPLTSQDSAGPPHDPAQLPAITSTLGAQIETLVDIAVSVLGREDQDLPSALGQIRTQLSDVMNVDSWYVALYSRQDNTVVFPLLHVQGREETWRTRPWSDAGFTETVLARGEGLLVPDTHHEAEEDAPAAEPAEAASSSCSLGGLAAAASTHPGQGSADAGAAAGQDTHDGGLAEGGHRAARAQMAAATTGTGIPDEYACRCWAGVPLAYRGQVFGVMAVRASEPGTYTQEDLETLRRTAMTVAYAVVGVIRRRQVLDPPAYGDPYELPAAVAPPAAEMLSAVLSPVLGAVRSAIPFDTATLQLRDEGRLVVVAAEGWPDPEQVLARSFEVDGEDPNAAAFRTGEITYLTDAGSSHPSFVGHGPFAGRPRSWLVIPLKHRRTGLPIAIMTFDKYHDVAYYGDLHCSIAGVIAPVLADAIARVASHRTRWIRAHRLTVVDLVRRYLAEHSEDSAGVDVPELVTLSARLLADAFNCRAGVTVTAGDAPFTVFAARVGASISTTTMTQSAAIEAAGQGRRLLSTTVTYLGHPLGTVHLHSSTEGQAGDEEDLSVLQGVAGLIAPYLARAGTVSANPPPMVDENAADAIGSASLVEDSQGIIRDCSPGLEQLVGANWRDIVDRHFLTLVPEAHQESVRAEWRTRAHGRPGRYESILLRKDGSEVAVRVHARPVMRENRLDHVDVTFTALTAGLHWALEPAGRLVQEAAADTPARVMQLVGTALADCGLQCVVLHRETPGETLRLDYISLSEDELLRVRRRAGIQFRGASLSLDASPEWQAILQEPSASWRPNPRALVAEVAGSGPARKDLSRFLRLMDTPPAIVVPALAHSGVLWVLAAWGSQLQRADVAPLAAFWRNAADKLTEADERTRNRRRGAPRTQLFRRRDRVGELLAPFLSVARDTLEADRVVLYGIRPASNDTYHVAASPAYPQPAAMVQSGSVAVQLCASTGIQYVVKDLGAPNESYLGPTSPADEGSGALAAMPLLESGLRLGILEILSREPGRFASDDEKARLESVRTSTERLLQAAIRPGPAVGWDAVASLHGIQSNSIADTLEGGAYRRYLSLVADVLAAEECSLWLQDQTDKDRLRRTASLKQAPNTGRELGARIGTDDGVGFTGYVAATGKVICEWGDGIRRNPKWRGNVTHQLDLYATGRCDSVLVVPIPRPDGTLPALGVLKCENKLTGPDDPPRFTVADRKQLQRIAGALADELPAWITREERLRANLRDIGGVHRDRIHSIRSTISVTTNWGLQDVVDNWDMLDDSEKQRELRRAIANLREAAGKLLVVEELVLRRMGSTAPADLPKLIRLKVEQFSLDNCTDLELPDDLMVDDEVAAAVYDFIAEQLTNVCKYAQIDRDLPGQVLVSVTVRLDEIEVLVRDLGVGVEHSLGEGAFRVLRNCVTPLGGTWHQPRAAEHGRGLEVRATMPLNRFAGPERRDSLNRGDDHA